jgi:Tol biopolymer transport system component
MFAGGLGSGGVFSVVAEVDRETIRRPCEQGDAGLGRAEVGRRIDWSPDGRKIAYSSSAIAGNHGDFYVMIADGSGVRNLTRSAAGEWGLTWSPDGRRIAFGRSFDRHFGIYVMNADGSGQRRLTRNAGWMVWSPAQKK